MNYGKMGLGLAAFAVGATAWVVGVGKFGPKPGSGARPGGNAARSPANTMPGVGAVPGDSVTAPIDPRPADMAAAPVGMAEQPKPAPSGHSDPGAEHVPTDLMGDHRPAPGDRAPEAFRPDPTAEPTADEREALRPATGPAPTLVADRGSGFTEATGAA